MMKLFGKIAVVLLILGGCCAQEWAQEKTQIITLPNNVIKVQLEEGDRVTFSVGWRQEDLMDLDLYLYPEGNAFMNSGYIESSQDVTNPEVLSYTSPRQTLYFLRIGFYQSIVGAPFTIQILINNIPVKTYQKTISSSLIVQTMSINHCYFQIDGTEIENNQTELAIVELDLNEREEVGRGASEIHYVGERLAGNNWVFQIGLDIDLGQPLYDLVTIGQFTIKSGNRDFIAGPGIFRCAIDCENIPQAIGSGDDPMSCQCPENFYWDQITHKCLVLCFKIHYAYSERISDTECACKYPFQWQDDNQCHINCDRIQNTEKALTSTSCKCEEPYLWSQSNFLCYEPDPTILSEGYNPIIALAIIIGVLIIVVIILTCKLYLDEKDLEDEARKAEHKAKNQSLLRSRRTISQNGDSKIYHSHGLVSKEVLHIRDEQQQQPPLKRENQRNNMETEIEQEQRMIRMKKTKDELSLNQKDQRFRNTVPVFITSSTKKQKVDVNDGGDDDDDGDDDEMHYEDTRRNVLNISNKSRKSEDKQESVLSDGKKQQLQNQNQTHEAKNQ